MILATASLDERESWHNVFLTAMRQNQSDAIDNMSAVPKSQHSPSATIRHSVSPRLEPSKSQGKVSSDIGLQGENTVDPLDHHGHSRVAQTVQSIIRRASTLVRHNHHLSDLENQFNHDHDQLQSLAIGDVPPLPPQWTPPETIIERLSKTAEIPLGSPASQVRQEFLDLPLAPTIVSMDFFPATLHPLAQELEYNGCLGITMAITTLRSNELQSFAPKPSQLAQDFKLEKAPLHKHNNTRKMAGNTHLDQSTKEASLHAPIQEEDAPASCQEKRVIDADMRIGPIRASLSDAALRAIMHIFDLIYPQTKPKFSKGSSQSFKYEEASRGSDNEEEAQSQLRRGGPHLLALSLVVESVRLSLITTPAVELPETELDKITRVDALMQNITVNTCPLPNCNPYPQVGNKDTTEFVEVPHALAITCAVIRFVFPSLPPITNHGTTQIASHLMAIVNSSVVQPKQEIHSRQTNETELKVYPVLEDIASNQSQIQPFRDVPQHRMASIAYTIENVWKSAWGWTSTAHSPKYTKQETNWPESSPNSPRRSYSDERTLRLRSVSQSDMNYTDNSLTEGKNQAGRWKLFQNILPRRPKLARSSSESLDHSNFESMLKASALEQDAVNLNEASNLPQQRFKHKGSQNSVFSDRQPQVRDTQRNTEVNSMSSIVPEQGSPHLHQLPVLVYDFIHLTFAGSTRGFPPAFDFSLINMFSGTSLRCCWANPTSVAQGGMNSFVNWNPHETWSTEGCDCSQRHEILPLNVPGPALLRLQRLALDVLVATSRKGLVASSLFFSL